MVASVLAIASTLTVFGQIAPPTLSLLPAGQYSAPYGSEQVFVATAAGNGGRAIQRVEFYYDGVKLAEDMTPPYTFVLLGPPALGPHQVLARAVDTANAASDVVTILELTDPIGQAPAVALTYPTAGLVGRVGQSLALEANANDSDGTIVGVTFLLDETTVLGTDTSAPYTSSWTPALGGMNTIRAIARDNSGRTSSSSLTITVVSNSAPVAALTSPVAGAVLQTGQQVQLTANADDSDGGISGVSFYVDGVLVGADTTAPYSLSWTPPLPGVYTLFVRAVDNLGVSTDSATMQFSVANGNAPKVQIETPQLNSIVLTTLETEILATATDAENSITSVRFTVDGVDLSTVTVPPYSTLWQPGIPGSHEIVAYATDSSGAIGVSTPVLVNVPFNARPSPLVDATEFVTSTLSDLADRTPEEEELELLVAQFNRGTQTRPGFTASLFESAYFAESKQLTMLYRAILGEWPTPTELATLRNAATAGSGNVNIGDDHGNNFSNATVLVGQTTAGFLESLGDADVFSFTVANDNTLVTLRTLGSTDTTGELYDSSENLIASDDQTGTGNNFEIIRALDAGTYYIAVEGWLNFTLGAYTLEVIGPDLDGEVAGGQALQLTTAVNALTSSTEYKQRYGSFSVVTDAERRTFVGRVFSNLYDQTASLQQIQLGATAIQQLGADVYLAALAAGEKITINASRVDPITNAPNISATLRTAAAISATLQIRPTNLLISQYETLDPLGLADALLDRVEYENRFITITKSPESQNLALGAGLTLSVDARGTQPMTYQWFRNGVALSGSRSPVLFRNSVTTNDSGFYAVEVRNSVGSVYSPSAIVVVGGESNRISNLSTRGVTGTSDRAMIAGFVVKGAARPFLVRAAGSTLKSFGVSNPVVDPSVELIQNGILVGSNNDWGGSPAIADATAQVGAFAFPVDSKESSLLVSLGPGSYSAVVGSAGQTGSTLVEVYDVNPQQGDDLKNVATRGLVGSSAEPSLIGGFVVRGAASSRVLVRAVGPGLAGFGVTDAASDVRVVVRNSAGVAVGSNDNWEDSGNGSMVTASSESVGAFELVSGSKDAAVVLTLVGGAYTAEVAGVNGAIGTALIEIYELP